MNELLEQFRELFPEFDSLSDSLIEMYLDLASCIFGACQKAQLYLTAHLIALDQANGIGQAGDGTGGTIDGGMGETTSEKVGELQVTLKAMAESGLETYYTSTPYGRRYLALKKVCPTYVYSPRVFVSGTANS